MQIGVITLENNLALFGKPEMCIYPAVQEFRAQVHTLEKLLNVSFKKYVHSGIICNSREVETTWMCVYGEKFINLWYRNTR